MASHYAKSLNPIFESQSSPFILAAWFAQCTVLLEKKTWKFSNTVGAVRVSIHIFDTGGQTID